MEKRNFLTKPFVWIKNNIELCFWLSSFLFLAFSDPNSSSHFSLCPIKMLGMGTCPGCGLGHSISALFRLNIVQSWSFHWLGIPAFFIILHRIYQLSSWAKIIDIFLSVVDKKKHK